MAIGNALLNKFLCCSNIKLPMYNGHYITGRNISLFSNLACIENSLTNLTCGCKQLCCDCKKNLGI